jgi:hypothetical protein
VNQYFLFISNPEKMFFAPGSKIFLQQYRPKADSCTAAINALPKTVLPNFRQQLMWTLQSSGPRWLHDVEHDETASLHVVDGGGHSDGTRNF